MPQQVSIPDGTVLEFPDGMSQDDMRAAIYKNFPTLKKKADLSAEMKSTQLKGDALNALTDTLGIAENLVSNVAHPIKSIEAGIEDVASRVSGSPKQLLVRPSQVMETPAFGTIPQVPQQEGATKQVLAGTANAVIDFVNYMQTPEGVATLGIGGLPKAAQQNVLKAIGTKMVTEAPQQFNAAVQAAQSGNTQDAAKHTVSFLGQTAMGALAGKAGMAEAPVSPAAIEGKMANLETPKAEAINPDLPKTAPLTAAAVEAVSPKPKLTPEQIALQKELVGELGAEVAATPEAPKAEARATTIEPAPPEERPLGMGISAGPGAISFQPLAQKLQRTWEGFKNLIKTTPQREDMAAHLDAADTQARVAGQQSGNSIKLDVPNKMDRQAIPFIIEAKGDVNALNDMLVKTTAGRNADASNAIRHAINNLPRLQPEAAKAEAIFDNQINFEQNSGIDVDNLDAYVPHIYDQDMFMGVNRPVVLAKPAGVGASSAFRKQRVFQTYADAIEAGYKPKSLDVADLIEHRVNVGTRLVNRKKWGDALRAIPDPTDGKPIVTDLITQPKGTQVTPAGYQQFEIMPGVRVAVHDNFARIFEALTGRSKINTSTFGKLALEAEGALKHSILLFDTFHASRIMQKQFFVSGRVGWEKGKSLLEYADADLHKAVQQDLITPKIETWVRQNRPTAQLLLKEGLNVGRIQESLYNSVARSLPIAGRFNKWVFEKVTRGAMMETAIREFERMQRTNPNLTDTQVARKVSRDLNIYFGNIGRQGWFKEATKQDFLRLAFLAPQWFESMAQSEARAYGQLAKAPFTGKVGTLGKGMVGGIAAYILGTQILNYATRGHSTFENPEPGRKFDAFIPDIATPLLNKATGGDRTVGEGYWLSPLSVPAEVTHDMIRYSRDLAPKEESVAPVAAGARILANKLSPPARATKTLLSGEEFGKSLPGSWERVKAAAIDLKPTPIATQGAISESRPGQFQRQIMASAGFKTEPVIPEGKEKAINRAKLNDYIDRVTREARKLPVDKRADYVNGKIEEDKLSGEDAAIARKKIFGKIKYP